MTTPLEFCRWQASDGVASLTLARPPLNVLHLPMLRELQRALAVGAKDGSLRALILRGEGKMFSAGVDVADHTADKVGEMIPLFDSVCVALAEFPCPTVAVVHGHALGGGCELVTCCDLVLAAEGAQLGQPEIRLATIAPIAALRLPSLVGYRRAAGFLFLGETVSATEAVQLGLINRAVPAPELDAAAEQVIGKLRAMSAPAARLGKRALRLGAAGWTSLPAVEEMYLTELMSTEDAHEGVASFLEKRAPVWKHR